MIDGSNISCNLNKFKCDWQYAACTFGNLDMSDFDPTAGGYVSVPEYHWFPDAWAEQCWRLREDAMEIAYRVTIMPSKVK